MGSRNPRERLLTCAHRAASSCLPRRRYWADSLPTDASFQLVPLSLARSLAKQLEAVDLGCCHKQAPKAVTRRRSSRRCFGAVLLRRTGWRFLASWRPRSNRCHPLRPAPGAPSGTSAGTFSPPRARADPLPASFGSNSPSGLNIQPSSAHFHVTPSPRRVAAAKTCNEVLGRLAAGAPMRAQSRPAPWLPQPGWRSAPERPSRETAFADDGSWRVVPRADAMNLAPMKRPHPRIPTSLKVLFMQLLPPGSTGWPIQSFHLLAASSSAYDGGRSVAAWPLLQVQGISVLGHSALGRDTTSHASRPIKLWIPFRTKGLRHFNPVQSFSLSFPPVHFRYSTQAR